LNYHRNVYNYFGNRNKNIMVSNPKCTNLSVRAVKEENFIYIFYLLNETLTYKIYMKFLSL